MRHWRFATYNVHGLLGMDGRRDPARILTILKAIDADCVALQEFVDSPHAGHGSQLQHWRDTLGLSHAHFAPAFQRTGETFGNALLARLPVAAIREHDFSAPLCYRRVTLQARLQVAAGSELLVTVVHLGLSSRAKAVQRPLLEALLKADDTPHVVLGDFNEWQPWNHTFRMLRQSFTCGPALPTFPAVAPALALDRIWVRPKARLVSTHVARQPLTRLASDHLPVVATLEL